MTDRYYVYIIQDSEGIPRYVGKGTGRRSASHRWNRSNRRVRQLCNSGSAHTCKILDLMSEANAIAVEERLIKTLGREGFDEGGILYNLRQTGAKSHHAWNKGSKGLSKGGVPKGTRCSDERRKLMQQIGRERGYGKWMIGRSPWNKGLRGKDITNKRMLYTTERRKEAGRKAWETRKARLGTMKESTE